MKYLPRDCPFLKKEAQQLQEVELTIVGGDSEPWWRDYERNLGWKIF